MLLKSGADPSIKNVAGETPGALACTFGSPSLRSTPFTYSSSLGNAVQLKKPQLAQVFGSLMGQQMLDSMMHTRR